MGREEGGPGKRDYFKETVEQFHLARTNAGTETRQRLNRDLMEIYVDPLKIYYRGTTFFRAGLGEPDDIVNGFFSDRLGRDDYYLAQWKRSGLRLRHWLMGGLKLYLHELGRRQRRAKYVDVDELAEPKDDAAIDPAQELDRAFTRGIVVEAMRRAKRYCEDKLSTDHWQVFVHHHQSGKSFVEIAADLGATPERVRAMNRTVETHFGRALRDLIAHDISDTGDIDDELREIWRSFD